MLVLSLETLPTQPQTVFMNEDYVIPQPLQAEYPLPTNVVDQSDDGNVSRDLSPTSQPHTEGDNIQKSLLANITMETLYVHVYLLV